VDTTTVSPSTATSITTQLTSQNASFIAAPVFGATPVAVQGQLLMAVAGPPAALETILPYLTPLTRSVIRVSETPRDAILLKTTGNFITAGMAEVLGEAFVLGEKAGLSLEVLDQLVRENYGAYAGSIATKLVDGVYAPPKGERARSDVNLAVKDVGHGIALATEVGTPLDVAQVTMKRLKMAQQWGEERQRALDSSAVYGVLREEVGLEFERRVVLERRNRDGNTEHDA
jgi:3-hydroxyisobutyrate dehydrogenase-like beta-hydroxyacid dehydrogenase